MCGLVELATDPFEALARLGAARKFDAPESFRAISGAKAFHAAAVLLD